MPSLLAPADIRTHIETDLPDVAVQRIIDAEEAEIVTRFGPHTTETETFEVSQWDVSQGGLGSAAAPWGEVFPYGASTEIILGRPCQTLTTVTEWIGVVTTVLDATDYELYESRRLMRVTTGLHPRMGWGHRVTVLYAPVSDSARRVRVLIDLCRLALAHTGLKADRFGDFSTTSYDDYQTEREQILSTLRRRLFV